MEAKLSSEGREWRRRQALNLSREGWSQHKIAKAVGVDQSSVSRWLSAVAEEGEDALKRRPHPGAPSAMSAQDLERLKELLREDAQIYGFSGQIWTRARIAELIARKFDIVYSHAHISKLMRKIGFSLQKPRKRAYQRDEQAIAKWKEKEGPALKKKSKTEAVFFLDEMGVQLLPSVEKTYAPIGQTPILRAPLARKHISVIGALGLSGKLYTHGQPNAFNGETVLEFVKKLATRVSGPLTLVWDNAKIHKTKKLKEYLASEEGKTISIKYLPAYAPELNPIESVWHHIKNVQLKNVCCLNLDELKIKLFASSQRVRFNKRVIDGCIRQSHCYA